MRRRTLGYYEPPVVEPPKKISIKFIDHTGAIIKEQLCDYGDTIVYPELPANLYLTSNNLDALSISFDRWTHNNTIAEYDMVIGAIYTPLFSDLIIGMTTLESLAYLHLNINKASSSGNLNYRIDCWNSIGDNLFTLNVTRPTTSGVIKDLIPIGRNHRYLTVTITTNTSLCNLGISTAQSGIFTDTDMTKIHPTKLYISNRVRFFRNSLNDSMTWMEELILPDIGGTGSNENAGVIRPLDYVSGESTLFVNATKLKALIVPSTYSLQGTLFNNCTNLKYIVTENTVRQSQMRIADCPALEYFESVRMGTDLPNNYISGDLSSLKTLVISNNITTPNGALLSNGNVVDKLVILYGTYVLNGFNWLNNINNTTNIYVSDSIWNKYQSSTWIPIKNQIYKLSDITNV